MDKFFMSLPDSIRLPLLHDNKATREGLFNQISQVAANFKEEDVLVMYFSGHGSSFKDDTGNIVQAICLYDWMLREDELWYELSWRLKGFVPKIIFIADCCKAGGLLRDNESLLKEKNEQLIKAIPDKTRDATKSKWPNYDLRWGAFRAASPPENLSIVALLGCGAKEVAIAIRDYSFFTESLLKVLGDSEIDSYDELMTATSSYLQTLKPSSEQNPEIDRPGMFLMGHSDSRPFENFSFKAKSREETNFSETLKPLNMKPINPNDLKNFICVDIDHRSDDEKEHVIIGHIFVEPYDEPMYLDFTQTKAPTEDDLDWECEIDISHEYSDNDNELVGFDKVKVNGKWYWLYVIEKLIPAFEKDDGSIVYAGFKPTLKVRGQDPKRHDGTIHYP